MARVFFYVRNSKITNPKVIRAAFDPEGIGGISLKDGKYSLDLVKEGKRSPALNGYLHGVVIPLVFQGLKDIGHENVRDVHDAKLVIKSLFLKVKVINQETGEVITEYIKDTSKLTNEETWVFIEQVVQWAAEYLNVLIPAPSSQSSIEYFK